MYIHVDDILVFSGSVDEHIDHLCQVFKRMQELGFKVLYLSDVVSQEGISPDPEKLRPMDCFPVPTSVKSLHGFLGHAKYYCWFVPGFSKNVFTAVVKCSVSFEREMSYFI